MSEKNRAFVANPKEKAVTPEVVFEVNDSAASEQLVSILRKEISAPVMLGVILSDEKLRQEFAASNPHFYQDVYLIVKAEADARTKCIESEPKIAEDAYRFALRGQTIALLLTVLGLFVAVLCAYWGFPQCAAAIGFAAFTPGVISALVNRNSGDNENQKQK